LGEKLVLEPLWRSESVLAEHAHQSIHVASGERVALIAAILDVLWCLVPGRSKVNTLRLLAAHEALVVLGLVLEELLDEGVLLVLVRLKVGHGAERRLDILRRLERSHVKRLLLRHWPLLRARTGWPLLLARLRLLWVGRDVYLPKRTHGHWVLCLLPLKTLCIACAKSVHRSPCLLVMESVPTPYPWSILSRSASIWGSAWRTSLMSCRR
jgi:hypothetical protein